MQNYPTCKELITARVSVFCRCMCNGHSEVCDQEGGLNCRCDNNTETKCSTEDKVKISCHEVQVNLYSISSHGDHSRKKNLRLAQWLSW